jgi:hypothetical protein
VIAKLRVHSCQGPELGIYSTLYWLMRKANFGAGLGLGRATASALPAVGGEVALVDGAGVTTEEGDAVGTTVGCGPLVAGAELAGPICAVGVGEAADRNGEGSDLAGAADRGGAGEKVARPSGRTYR